MSTFVQWVHVSAAVLGVGGIAFLVFILLPSMSKLEGEQREALLQAVLGKFRWVSWAVIFLLFVSGLYNVRQYYWEVPWGRAWLLLTIKIVLAMAVFAIALGLSIPIKFLNWLRARRQMWLGIALGLAMLVILISAYLRRS